MDTISVPANEHHDQFQGDNSEGNVELDDVFGLEDVFFKVIQSRDHLDPLLMLSITGRLKIPYSKFQSMD